MAGWQRRRWKKQQFDWGLTIEYDRRRTAVLEELGSRVIRLWDDGVLRDTDVVTEAKRFTTRSFRHQ